MYGMVFIFDIRITVQFHTYTNILIHSFAILNSPDTGTTHWAWPSGLGYRVDFLWCTPIMTGTKAIFWFFDFHKCLFLWGIWVVCLINPCPGRGQYRAGFSNCKISAKNSQPLGKLLIHLIVCYPSHHSGAWISKGQDLKTTFWIWTAFWCWTPFLILFSRWWQLGD